jgi:hypothetical protein
VQKEPTMDYLATVMAGIDEAYAHAEAEVAEARAQLKEAERKFETVKALRAVKEGKVPSSAPRAPKEAGRELQERIIAGHSRR